MILPKLKIGDKIARLPVVQGGMAVRISTAPLAAKVASVGGVGTIAGTGMQLSELKEEIRAAKSLTDGIVGVNVLFAARNFPDLVKTAMAEKVDFVVSGAGFSRDMFGWGKEFGVPVIPIVSSAKLAVLAQRLGAAAIVVEGVEAGGHLGTDTPLAELFPEVRKATSLPLIAAGGLADGQDVKKYFLMGADGVQLATRFLASHECTATLEYKMMHVNTDPSDIVMVESPVGMPGRAIRNPFSEKLRLNQPVPSRPCQNCLKKCSRAYCILDALDRAQKGDLVDGLIFSGDSAVKIKSILSVEEIMDELLGG